MSETWKSVVGYEGLYEVSTLGHVRSLPRIKQGKLNKNGTCTYYTTKEKTLSPKVDKDGYLGVTLYGIDGSRKCFRVHRLVANAFIDNPHNYEVVHHKDGCVTNNYVGNLAWVTPQENLFASDVFGQLSKIFSVPIVCKTKTGHLVGEYKSIKHASELLQIDARHISSVISGRRKHTKEYVFERIVNNGNQADVGR